MGVILKNKYGISDDEVDTLGGAFGIMRAIGGTKGAISF